VLSFYVVKDWQEGCERCKQILRYGGMGHTMSIHSKNDDIILQFGLHKPANRIVVNSPTTHGSIGLTTSLDPAMTLGCGGFGGNITSDNISPMHLLNIKRLAYETTPAPRSSSIKDESQAGLTPAIGVTTGAFSGSGSNAGGSAALGTSRGLSADTLRTRIDSFLASRGFTQGGAATPASPSAPVTPAAAPAPSAPPAADKPAAAPVAAAASTPPPAAAAPAPAVESPQTPAEFVCEDDVRQAMKANKKILLGERTIVTPSARDVGEQYHVFVTSLR
jgi:acetaldehyde dehydrogenase (acetylating)